MRYFVKTLRTIVEQHGEEFESDFALTVESDSFEDLTIERHGDELTVMHTYTQRGDLMRDPEVTFELQEDE